MGNLLFSHRTFIKIRKFDIDTVLLSSPESVFKLSVSLEYTKVVLELLSYTTLKGNIV